MSEYNPDRWVIVRFQKNKDVWYKVLGSWYGGYLNGDSWRLSSGLQKVEEEGNLYLMKNHSGSIYKCHKDGDGMHMTSAGVYGSIQEEAKKAGVEVSLIDVEQFNKEQGEPSVLAKEKRGSKS